MKRGDVVQVKAGFTMTLAGVVDDGDKKTVPFASGWYTDDNGRKLMVMLPVEHVEAVRL